MAVKQGGLEAALESNVEPLSLSAVFPPATQKDRHLHWSKDAGNYRPSAHCKYSILYHVDHTTRQSGRIAIGLLSRYPGRL